MDTVALCCSPRGRSTGDDDGTDSRTSPTPDEIDDLARRAQQGDRRRAGDAARRHPAAGAERVPRRAALQHRRRGRLPGGADQHRQQDRVLGRPRPVHDLDARGRGELGADDVPADANQAAGQRRRAARATRTRAPPASSPAPASTCSRRWRRSSATIPQYVEPLLLRDVYGMSYEEIAQQVDAPLGHGQGTDPSRSEAGPSAAARQRIARDMTTRGLVAPGSWRSPCCSPAARPATATPSRAPTRPPAPPRPNDGPAAANRLRRPGARRRPERAGRGPRLPATSATRASTRCTTSSTSRGHRDTSTLDGVETLVFRATDGRRPVPARPRRAAHRLRAQRRRRGGRLRGGRQGPRRRAPRSRPTAATPSRSTTAARPSRCAAPTTRSDFDTVGWQVTDSRRDLDHAGAVRRVHLVRRQRPARPTRRSTTSRSARRRPGSASPTASWCRARTSTATRSPAWHLDEPAASYLVTAAVGDFTDDRATGRRAASRSPTGPSAATPSRASGCGRPADLLDWIEERLGPYPFSSLGRPRGRLRERHGDPDHAHARQQRLHPEPGGDPARDGRTSGTATR